jgi:hypothetical protein
MLRVLAVWLAWLAGAHADTTEMSDEDGGQPRVGLMFQDARWYIEDGDWSTLPEPRQGEIANQKS